MGQADSPYSDFDRLDYFILGILLHEAHVNPSSLSLTDKEISNWLSSNGPVDLIAEKIEKLKNLELVVQTEVVDGERPDDGSVLSTRITAKGTAFLLNSADLVSQQFHGLTWDMPVEIEESLFSLLEIRDSDDLEDRNLNRLISASNRYVSVKDNQPIFDEIRKNLSVIKGEFATDHNKRELSIENLDGAIAEIEAFETLIESNWVSRPAAKNFLETLQYFEAVFVSSSKTLGAILAIAASLKLIFGLM